MNSSLKEYIPTLARYLGVSPAALYERQRELVRSGALDVEDGRGPGSGVRATARSVAVLLIAVLATDRLSETSELVKSIGEARSASRAEPFRLSFKEAVTLLILGRRKILQISILRSERVGIVRYRENGRVRSAEFRSASHSLSSGLRVEAALSPEIFNAIVSDLWESLRETMAQRIGGIQ